MTAPRSGWCAAPAGCRPHHESCRWPECSCSCHDTTTHPARRLPRVHDREDDDA